MAGRGRAEDPTEILLSRPQTRVRLRRMARARRFTLSVSRLDGAANLTLPPQASLAEARAFLERQGDWLERALGRTPPPRLVAPGDAVPFRGAELTLHVAPGPRRPPCASDGRLTVGGPPEAAAAQALAFLKAAARDALASAAERHAAAIRRRPARITLRDTRSRWGSCTSDGRLSFCWRLVMAPPDVLDYVAAHEAAHLAEMNHGPRFWALVEALRPDWRTHRDWLRRHGPGLHRIRFTS